MQFEPSKFGMVKLHDSGWSVCIAVMLIYMVFDLWSVTVVGSWAHLDIGEETTV